MRAALIALIEAMALRSMQGTYTGPPIGSAGQAQIVFHADFGGVFHLFRRAAQHFSQRAGSHRAGRAHFALAAHFGAGDRGVEL